MFCKKKKHLLTFFSINAPKFCYFEKMLYFAPNKLLSPMQTKEKYQLEVTVNASPQLIYQYISTPAGLASWYADDVRADEDTYTFVWNGIEETAQLLRQKLDEHIRFHWKEDEEATTYFEIRIRVNDLTQEVSLAITDFAPFDEIEEAKQLWLLQIADLKAKIGAN